MHYIDHYESPLGAITLAGDREGLTGLWIDGQKYYGASKGPDVKECSLPVFCDTKCWLDYYFRGEIPSFTPAIKLQGSEFRMAVWEILLQIPYGKTMTYGQIAAELAAQRGLERMSAQAVGGAVGHNPISIIVPCHRVLGAGGRLTGYAGGIDKKAYLLELEGVKYEN